MYELFTNGLDHDGTALLYQRGIHPSFVPQCKDAFLKYDCCPGVVLRNLRQMTDPNSAVPLPSVGQLSNYKKRLTKAYRNDPDSLHTLDNVRTFCEENRVTDKAAYDTLSSDKFFVLGFRIYLDTNAREQICFCYSCKGTKLKFSIIIYFNIRTSYL